MKPETLLQSIADPFRQFIRSDSSSGILLVVAAVIALIWSNSPLSAIYFNLWDTPVSISIGEDSFSKPLLLWVNDGLMAIFFFTIGLEIKKEVLDGELSTPRKAALPLIAAVGGMVVPVGLFFLLQGSGAGQEAWGIPMATDIAFSLGILSLLGSRVPLGMKVFLTAFAIVDDLGAILVITIFYSHEVNWSALAFSGGILGFLFLCNYALSIKRNWIYLLGGLGVWYYMFKSGIHPTIAGVLVAMTIPATNKLRARMFTDGIEDFLDEFRLDKADGGGPFLPDPELNQLQKLRNRARSVLPPLQRLEYQFNEFVAFFVLPLFALANGGIKIESGGEVFGQPLFLNIAVALALGKMIGIFSFSWLAVKLRVTDLPLQTNWTQMIGLGLLGGIGFTMALFISNLALDSPDLLSQAKLGTLTGSLAAGVSGYLILRQSLMGKAQQPLEEETSATKE